MKIFGFYIARELPVVEKTVEVEKIVEKIEYVALGDEVSVYCATTPRPRHFLWDEPYPEWNGKKFLSCNQALEECPGSVVNKIAAYRVGKDYFTRGNVEKITVQPKPRVPKGKAA